MTAPTPQRVAAELGESGAMSVSDLKKLLKDTAAGKVPGLPEIRRLAWSYLAALQMIGEA
jgi:hypothetical protein